MPVSPRVTEPCKPMNHACRRRGKLMKQSFVCRIQKVEIIGAWALAPTATDRSRLLADAFAGGPHAFPPGAAAWSIEALPSSPVRWRPAAPARNRRRAVPAPHWHASRSHLLRTHQHGHQRRRHQQHRPQLAGATAAVPGVQIAGDAHAAPHIRTSAAFMRHAAATRLPMAVLLRGAARGRAADGPRAIARPTATQREVRHACDRPEPSAPDDR